MRKGLHRILSVIFTAGQLVLPIYMAWLLWHDQLKEAVTVLRYTTSDAVVHAAIVCGVIAVVLHLFERRHTWAYANIYWVLAKGLKGRPGRIAERLSEASSPVTPHTFLLYTSGDDYLLARKINSWLERIFGLLFWPMTIVGFDRLVYGGGRSPLWAFIISGAVLIVLALFIMKLRNLAAAAFLLLWLGIVFFVQGVNESGVQAALVGIGLTVWDLWEQWQEKIGEQSEPPPPSPPAEPESV